MICLTTVNAQDSSRLFPKGIQYRWWLQRIMHLDNHLIGDDDALGTRSLSMSMSIPFQAECDWCIDVDYSEIAGYAAAAVAAADDAAAAAVIVYLIFFYFSTRLVDFPALDLLVNVVVDSLLR